MTQVETAKGVSSLPANQVKALNALLKTTSIGAAAEECGLGRATINRYLADETFSAIYREQRVLLLEATISGLLTLGAEAIQVLEGSMGEANEENLRLRAARATLDHIAKLVELERKLRDQGELEERLIRLEKAAEASGAGHTNRRGHRWGA